MDSYCVIHFKEIQEKVKILTFLAANTEADYKVTKDLKEYVAEKFSVNITDKIEMRDQGTNTVQKESENITKVTGDQTVTVEPTTIVKNNPVNNTADVVAPTINTLPTEQQHSSAPIVASSPIDINVFDQQVPVVEHQNQLTVTTIKDEPVNTTVDVVSPTVNNHIFDNIIAAQPFDVPADPQNLTNMNDYGTYVPYSERMVQPKQEKIDDEVVGVMDLVTGWNVVGTDEETTKEAIARNEETPSTSSRSRRIIERSRHSMDDDRNNKNEFIPERSTTRNDAPSSSRRSARTTKRPRYSMDEDTEESAAMKEIASSTSRRSGRITKQPKYSMNDDSDSETLSESRKTKKNNDQELVTKEENIADKCQKCGTVCTYYRQRKDHVMMHAKLMKYECMVDGCGFKSGYKCSMTDHFKSKHKDTARCFEEIALTREQTGEMNTIMEECFPGIPRVLDHTCRVCNGSVGGIGSNHTFNKRQHALHHVGFFSYKCIKDGCQFESKTKRSMNLHLTRTYGESAKGKFQTNKLTKEQELEIEEMLVKCFPKIDTNREEVGESD